uniref:Uncharacterized protein n=1 Tax=Octopus bimaculoides TaxID=37653 RepID=A0A0L8I3Q7_OCTBM
MGLLSMNHDILKPGHVRLCEDTCPQEAGESTCRFRSSLVTTSLLLTLLIHGRKAFNLQHNLILFLFNKNTSYASLSMATAFIRVVGSERKK